MHSQKSNHLLVCSDIEAWNDDGTIFLDRKFADGMQAYAERWNGPVTCVLHISKETKPIFGLSSSDSMKMFDTLTYVDNISLQEINFQQFDIALLPSDNFVQIKPIAKILNTLDIPVTYMIEYTLKTRFFTETHSLPKHSQRVKQYLYLIAEELERKLALIRCAGVQANGIPAFKNYGNNKNSIVYFDTRARNEDLISQTALRQRLSQQKDCDKIRLAFSGRLSKIKGIDHLLEAARQLKQGNLSFSLDIFGDGDSREWVENFIDLNCLGNEVSIHGPVNFYEELLPFIKSNIDLFIALHPQGDPSCTYVETFACGVPIIGFNNEAFSTLANESNAGLTSPVFDINNVCSKIEQLSNDHEELVRLSENALAFAKKHTMENTFSRRTTHLECVLSNY